MLKRKPRWDKIVNTFVAACKWFSLFNISFDAEVIRETKIKAKEIISACQGSH